jgi:DNA uptake protein ComE-like DNA-binding protein
VTVGRISEGIKGCDGHGPSLQKASFGNAKNNLMKQSLRTILGGLGRISAVICLCSGIANASSAPSKEWVKLENCRIMPNESNDGDSFHVTCKDTEYLFRLYLVDAREIEGALTASRLVEQAAYFGISVPEVIEAGRKAKQLVDQKLSEPFTVYTRMAGGLGRSRIPRYLGFIETKDGDIGELLVFNGLARVHGTRGAPPGVASSAQEIAKLQELEQKAKAAGRGAWNVKGMASQKFEPLPAPAIGLTSKEVPKMAHKIAAAPESKTETNDGAKLDINAATHEQLENIPGVGAGLSARIIAARPFKCADDLQEVKGVRSGKRYEELRPFFK